MSLMSVLHERRSSWGTLRDPARHLVDWFGGGSVSAAGVHVTADTAMQTTAVYAAVRVISETVGSLPCLLYERLAERGKKRAQRHPLYPILHDQANAEQTAPEFFETMQGHALLRGTAIAQKVMTRSGFVEQLIPLHPDRCQIIEYAPRRYAVKWTPLTGAPVTYLRDELFIHRGLSLDGITGLSPIRLLRNAIGLTIATEEFGARLFANGAKPGGILTSAKALGKAGRKNLRESFEEVHQGVENQHRLAVLEDGVTWQEVQISPDDAQMLESRKFQVTEIARAFRIPPHMIGDLERATFTNIEHQGLEFVTHCLRPWLVRLEKGLQMQLLTPTEREGHLVEFLVDALLRGDLKARYDAYAVGRQWGWLSPNDILELENRNPIGAQGDLYLVPLNMVPADQVGLEPPAPKTEVQTPANPEPDAAGARQALLADRVERSHRRILRDAYGRVLRKELTALRRAMGRLRTSRSAGEFLAWREPFYRELAGHAVRTVLPALQALAETVLVTFPASLEPTGVDELVRTFAGEAGRRYVDDSLAELEQLAEVDLATDEEVDRRLAEWEATRADQAAVREGVALAQLIVTLGARGLPSRKE